MDPYARQETFLLTFTQNIYDPLIRRDKNLKLEPALATKWGQTDPTTWFFDIRPNVKFQDGTPLTADDIVFSLNRANGPGSNMGSNFVSVKEIKKVGDLRVEVDDQVSRPAARRQMGGARHDVQGVGREEQRRQLGRHDQERGELRHPQRHGHRPLHAEGAPRRREDDPGRQSRTGGTSPRTTSPR